MTAPSLKQELHKSVNGRQVIGLLLLYSLLTLALTYPVFLHLATTAAGFDGRDSWQHVWYQWWLKETFLELGVWPDWVTYLYYPLVVSHPVLALHPYVPLVSLPLTLLFGPLVSYNLAFLLSFSLSGLTGYFLCRYLSRDTTAALLGGLIFAFYPNRLGHAAAGHLLLTTNYFLPLYALSLLILLKRPSLKIAVWHGLVTALLALAQPTHIGYGIIPIFLVLLTGRLTLLAGLKRSTVKRSTVKPSNVRLILLMGAILLAVVIFLPFAWPIFSQNQQGDLAYLTPDNLTEHSTDLLAFIMPSPYNPVLASSGLTPAFSTSIIGGLRDLEEQLAYPGLIALGLAGLALSRRWRTARLWLGLTLVCAVLSLGPWLKIGGAVTTLPLPYAWLINLPFFAWSRTPSRLNETVMLGLAILASLGAAWLLKGVGRWRLGIALGLAVLILSEYWVISPFPLEARPISAYYAALAQEKLHGGILEIPVSGSRRASNYAMYYQTIHQHPLAGGYIERDPPGSIELKEFLNQLVSPQPAQTVFRPPDEVERQAILADMNIERVIVHPDLMTDRAARATRDYLPQLLGPTLFADSDTLVYSVAPGEAPHLPAWQLLPDQENWEAVQVGAALRLKKNGYLFIYAAEAGEVELNLRIAAPAQPVALSFRLNDALTTNYSVETMADYTSGSISLRGGFNYLSLSTTPAQELEFLEISVQAVK